MACPSCQRSFEWRPGAQTLAESDYLLFAARIVTGTLLGEIRRTDGPGGALQGSIDPEQIAPTSFLAGRKVFGDGYTRDLVEDAARWGSEDVRNCLERLATEPLFARAKAACDTARKDRLFLAALTALELNIDDIGVELLKLRALGHRFYDTPAESDRRMIMYGETGASLYPRAVELVNEIVRELNAGSGGAAAPGRSAPIQKQKPARNIGKGLSILIVCALITLAASAFGARAIETPPAWLALGGAVLGALFYFAVYRGFRLMTGAGRWTSVALTVFGFPVLIGGLLFAIGEVLPMIDVPGLQEKIAGLDPGGDNGPQDSAGGDYFEGLNANNTDAAELDALIENW